MIFVSILDPLKTMALAWEGPDLLLICFMEGLLTEDVDPEFTGIRKRRTSEVRGLQVGGSASDTSLVTSNMESRLWHCKIECRSTCKVPSTSSSFYTWWGDGSLQDGALWAPGKSASPFQLPHKEERSSAAAETGCTEHRQAGVQSLAYGCLTEQLGF